MATHSKQDVFRHTIIHVTNHSKSPIKVSYTEQILAGNVPCITALKELEKEKKTIENQLNHITQKEHLKGHSMDWRRAT